MNFNPRSHERSDPVLSSVPLGSVPISIHAPTRGATISVFVSISSAYNFNPRSHERSDNNSTDLTKQLTYFNPRSHERSDADVDNRASYSKISIHAPTRGATLSAQNPHIYSLLFQSTLPREERRF